MRRASGLRAWVLGLSILFLLHKTNGDELDDLIMSVEAVVNQVADNATIAFLRRFPEVFACECSPHACASEFMVTDTCHQELGDAELCGSCTGQKVGRMDGGAARPSHGRQITGTRRSAAGSLKAGDGRVGAAQSHAASE